jgi:hypothetical protein
MPEPVSLLMIQFLDWVSSRRRTYAEAMDAWRTSCPRLSVWEDALVDGLIQVEGGGPSQQSEVTLTPRGRAILEGNRNHRSVPAGAAVGGETGAPP